jgi:hypothetical protein
MPSGVEVGEQRVVGVLVEVAPAADGEDAVVEALVGVLAGGGDAGGDAGARVDAAAPV